MVDKQKLCNHGAIKVWRFVALYSNFDAQYFNSSGGTTRFELPLGQYMQRQSAIR